MLDWQKDSAKGVIKLIKKSVNDNGGLLECWKYYLNIIDKDSLDIMFLIDRPFMEAVTKEI